MAASQELYGKECAGELPLRGSEMCGTSFGGKYGMQIDEVVADSGYGNEENYAYMERNGLDAYVMYNMFHAGTKHRYVGNDFSVRNMYCNAQEDCYVCPMDWHMQRCDT